MNVLTLRLNTWREARILADELTGWRFRGQLDASWMLSTVLERSGQRQETSPSLSKIEQEIIEEFKRRAHHFLPAPPPLENLIEWMALIQHFGGPTRLLDFTRSFYVAAFFAVERASAESAIWCVNHDALLEAVRRLIGIKETDESVWQVPHRTGAVLQKLLKQQQQGSFRGFPFILEVQPFRLNERLAVQQGIFLCPLVVEIPFIQSLTQTFALPPSAFADATAEAYNTVIHTGKMLKETSVIKLVLPLTIRRDVLRDLWNMNVTAATLFPGLDGFARSLHYYLGVR